MIDAEMQKELFMRMCEKHFAGFPGNKISIPDIGEVTLFDTPLIGFASAADELFTQFKQPAVIGSMFWTPMEWLPEAKTVVSFFFPFSEAVRSSNREDDKLPSTQWLYGRIEGQQFIDGYMKHLGDLLLQQGDKMCIPSLDERLAMQMEPTEEKGFHVNNRWSERHAAYACGLGTFGLSRGLITEKGMAGRFASIIMDRALPADLRFYTGVYEDCIRCGACAKNCPAGAISLAHGKNNAICSSYLNQYKEQFAPRYGCGKCQVGVPCEYQTPALNE